MVEQTMNLNETYTHISRANEATAMQDAPVSDDDMQKINGIAPVPLLTDQVYVRSMYLCSDQLCESDGCRFTPSALQQIVGLVIGQSVLTGHNRNSLPLARFFKAAIEPRGQNAQGEPIYFVRAWFYWLRETAGARDLLLNIDGGIYREVSIAWRYTHWKCSICQSEDGKCSHRVGETYEGNLCYRIIESVTEVLEGSLVYKGADKNTWLSGVHQHSFPQEATVVLLICDKNDPLLQQLTDMQLIDERYPLEEVKECFASAVDRLWIRSAFKESAVEHAQELLAENGVCLLEVFTPGGEQRFALTRYESSFEKQELSLNPEEAA